MLKSSVGQQANNDGPVDDGTEVSQNYNFMEDLFEGDIVLTVPQARYLLDEANGRKKRKVMRNPAGKWPTKSINYAFDSSIGKQKFFLLSQNLLQF